MSENIIQASINVLPYSVFPFSLNRITGSTLLRLSLMVYAEEGIPQNISTLNFALVDLDEEEDIPMTIAGGSSVLEGVSGSPAGTLLVLEWDINEDLEEDYFNRIIRITSGLSDGTNTSKESVKYFAVNKEVVDKYIKRSEVPQYALGNVSSLASRLPRRKND